MNILEKLDNNTLLICNNNTKEKILLEISNTDKLINLKIMTLNEFLNNYFFSYDQKTLYYIKNKYKVTREIALIYLSNLKYIINSKINDSKILFLKELYKDLKNNNLLKYNKLFKNYLKDKKIIVYNLDLSNFILSILNKYNTEYINTNLNIRSNNIIYHFNTIEEEVEYTFNRISELIKNGISTKNIKLVLLGNEYNIIIKRFSKLYNIPLNNLEKNSIYKTLEASNFLKLIKDNKTKEEIYEYLKPNLDDYLYNKFLNIINKYYFVDNLIDVIDLIEYDLKNNYLKELRVKDAIDIISLNSNLVSESDHVFVLGFNAENIPRIYKDIDYLDDHLKELLNLNTSIKKNKLEKIKIINNINNINNINFSYKDNTPYNSYLKSNLIEELGLTIEDINLENTTSNLYNKIKLTASLDNLLKYNVKDNNLSKLYNTYNDIPYLSYDNSFKPLKDFKLDKISLSYSSINSYYECSFKYYINNILKLNIYSLSFKQFIGTMFHDILSHIYDHDFNYDLLWNNYLKDKIFSKKEEFYLKDLKLELENIIKVIKYQYSLTSLKDVLLEKKITIDYPNNCYLTGIIDKIMFKEVNNNTYLSIIDYKTGTPSINIDNIKYGLDMQLPIYVYLTIKSNIFKNPQIIGFYLEKILHEKTNNQNDKQDIDNLKLLGYTINKEELVSMFDSSYHESQMIKSMKITSKGFGYYSKVLSTDDINKLLDLVENKVKDTFKLILDGNFNINPKVLKGENVSCKYCKYNDLCFKKGSDLVYLKEI